MRPPAGGRRKIDREAIEEWQSIIRDTAILVIGAFMLLFETIFREAPNPYVLGAGLALLGVPPALRLDQARRARRPPTSLYEDEDPYDGPDGYYRSTGKR